MLAHRGYVTLCKSYNMSNNDTGADNFFSEALGYGWKCSQITEQVAVDLMLVALVAMFLKQKT